MDRIIRTFWFGLPLGLVSSVTIACQSAQAQSEQPIASEQAVAAHEEPEPEAAADPLAFTLNLDWTNAYYFRGVLQENQGVIIQPALKVTYTLLQEDSTKLDAFFGNWNSIHDRATGASTTDDTIEHWYEADLYAGLTLAVDDWSFAVSYIFYTSPSDAFETVQELDFGVSFNDSDLLGKFALHPYVLLGLETGADFTDGPHTHRGTYLELGIAPGLELDMGGFKLPLTFPASVGLSLDDYYEDANGDSDTFGFAQVGVKTSIPLCENEALKLNTGVSLLMLGDNMSDINAGDETEIIATIGLQWDF